MLEVVDGAVRFLGLPGEHFAQGSKSAGTLRDSYSALLINGPLPPALVEHCCPHFTDF